MPRAALLASRRVILAACLVLAACAGTGKGGDAIPATGVEVAAFRPVDARMRGILRQLDIPGASITVAKDGRILYQRGFGWTDRAHAQPVALLTVFRIASVSKPMTAVGVLRAYEDDLPAALDRPVFGPGGILAGPRYAQVKDPRVYRVTLRDLLQHTAGWDSSVYEPQYDYVAIARALGVPAPAGAGDIVRYMLAQRELQHEPGTRFVYSNFGFNVLGRVLEAKTGLPYAEAMQRLVFVPAGVRTAAIGGDRLAQRLPAETIYNDDPRWPDVPSATGTGSGPESYNAFHMAAMDAHGGWVMTSADMVRLADAVDGRSGVPRLLAPATVQRMTARDPRLPDTRFGLGWDVSDNGWSHTGALTTGTHSKLEHLDNGITWAVVYNSLPADPDRGMDGLKATFATSVGELRTVVLECAAAAP